MAGTVRHISIGLLCAIYLLVCCAGLQGTLQVPAISCGPQSLTGASAGSKERPRIVWVQRRHIPLVKSVSAPGETACTDEFPTATHKSVLVPLCFRSDVFLPCFLTSISDRAPPRA
jgi:hypothetical protein